MNVLGHILYAIAAAALLLCVPAHAYDSGAGYFLFFGLLATWRYAWALTNLVRALWFRHVAYPYRKRRAQAVPYAGGRAFFLVTSFRIDTEITLRVYRSIFEAASRCPDGSVVTASIVDMADQRLIEKLHEGYPDVALDIVRIEGSGKREALARGFEAIAERRPDSRDLLLLVDGDSCVPEDIFESAHPFFRADPGVGALTTDELCEVVGDETFQNWYSLRFAQRQMMMCSTGLSERVLTLTGRMSVIRADLATDPDFVEHVREDHLDHWRLGRIRFLTGDDKSTWYWLLTRGYRMLYLPDVQSLSMESQPDPSFRKSADVLMARWFGNMLRNNGRASALGPSRIGLFTWWSVVDQRISMWTSLTGPAAALMGAFAIDFRILLGYLGWVMLTRWITCAMLLLFRSEFPIQYPFLLYFNQIYGAWLKTRIVFRPDKQKWTRQDFVYASEPKALGQRVAEASSVWVRGLAFLAFLTAVAAATGLMTR